MRATAAPEEGNKVRLSVEIDEAELDQALEEVVRRLGHEIRVKGFRPGKVPRRVIEARMGGAGALRSEAIREALPDFYARAVSDTEVDPIDQPDIDITAGDESGPVSFDAVVEVRPTVKIPGYQGLVVTLPSLEVPDEEVTAQLDRLRANSGELVVVDRAVATGDQVTLDLKGRRVREDDDDAPADDSDLVAEDLLYEVGSGGVVPGLDDAVLEAGPGEVVEFTTDPDATGTAIEFLVTVKEVKEVVLPEATDEWAKEESEFDTVEALTDDLRDRMRRIRVVQAQMALQQRTVEALTELVTEDVPEVLVADELRRLLHDLGHRLEHQGMELGQYLAATGRSEEELVAEFREAALRSVKADLALRALAEAESIDLTEEELDEELASMAERLQLPPDQLRDQLERAGRLAAVRSERRTAKAARWLADHVELVDEEGGPVSREDLEANQAEDKPAAKATATDSTAPDSTAQDNAEDQAEEDGE